MLVVDADLRRPTVHQLLGLPAGPGLVDLLTGRVSLVEALIELPDYRLTVLRAGGSYDHPAEMLGSAPMRRLMDTPPHGVRSHRHRFGAGDRGRPGRNRAARRRDSCWSFGKG